MLDGDVYDYLMDIPTKKWSRYAFDPRAKSLYITNNVYESFNSWTNNLRDKPILTMLDGRRYKIMSSFHRKIELRSIW